MHLSNRPPEISRALLAATGVILGRLECSINALHEYMTQLGRNQRALCSLGGVEDLGKGGPLLSDVIFHIPCHTPNSTFYGDFARIISF